MAQTPTTKTTTTAMRTTYPAHVAREVAALRPDLAATDAIAAVLMAEPALTAQEVIDSLDQWTAPFLDVEERWYDNQHCPRGQTTYCWETDGAVHVMASSDIEPPRGVFRGGGRRVCRITGGTYAFRVAEGRNVNGSMWLRVGPIFARGGEHESETGG